MASGIGIASEVLDSYNEIQVRKQGSLVSERYKFIMYRINEAGTEIVIDKDCTKRRKDFDGDCNVLKTITNLFPEKQCRYCLYDCAYENKDSPKEELVFIMWAPEDCCVKQKMLYASSKRALTEKLKGIKHEWQINDLVPDVSDLIEKLGGSSTVKKLEGREMS